MTGRVRAYLELARVSNLPTVLTNVLVGSALGAGPLAAGWPWRAAGSIVVGAGLLYVAGMALNDVVDARIDAAERSARPIPSGRISRRAALVFTLTCFTLGLGAFATAGLVALAGATILAVAIILYDLLHKRVAASLVLMGLCRGLVYVVAAVTTARTLDRPLPAVPLLAVAGAMTVYVLAVTILARREGRPAASPAARGGAGPTAILAAVALTPAVVLVPAASTAARIGAIVAGIVVVAWLLRAARHLRPDPPRIPHAVMAWLAAICLIDAAFAVQLDAPALALACIACFLLTTWSHRRILGS